MLASQSQSLRQVAATPGASDAHDSCTRTLFALNALLPETAGFALWDTSGNILCSGKGARQGEYNVRDRLWFQSAVTRQDIATGAYELAPPDNEPSLGFGLPIRDAEGGNRCVSLDRTATRPSR